MSILTLEDSFETKLHDINVRKYIFNIIRGRVTSYNHSFKKLLKEIDTDFQQDTQIITDIKSLNNSELKLLNQKIKRFNKVFDKINNMYFNKDYFDDGELRQLFSSISRQAHKVENISHKYLYINSDSSPIPDYMKNGLMGFSQENISKKLSPDN